MTTTQKRMQILTKKWVDPHYKCLEGLDEQTIFNICMRMFREEGPSDHELSDDDDEVAEVAEVAEVPNVTP
jgi:hypothetical protein